MQINVICFGLLPAIVNSCCCSSWDGAEATGRGGAGGEGKHGPWERARGKPPAGPGSGVPQRMILGTRSLPRGGDVASCLRGGAAWSGPAERLGDFGGSCRCTPALRGAALGWHCHPNPKRLGRLTPDSGWVGGFGGFTVNAALNAGGSWRGTGWLGRCPEKGLAVSFLLQTRRGGAVSMRATLSGEGDNRNPSSRAQRRRGRLGLAPRRVGRWFALPGTWIPLWGKRGC